MFSAKCATIHKRTNTLNLLIHVWLKQTNRFDLKHNHISHCGNYTNPALLQEHNTSGHLDIFTAQFFQTHGNRKSGKNMEKCTAHHLREYSGEDFYFGKQT
ncbi:hypothetical protein LDENG_00026730 [Lucifuga dentata]|nr:hypothetical protein LDENG_00026730 [Lucifuga dentata]